VFHFPLINLPGYDLVLPEEFEPIAGDGEVESFHLMGPALGAPRARKGSFRTIFSWDNQQWPWMVVIGAISWFVNGIIMG
jgi:hypothetical protein